ncbi:response regulator transcription factor [Halovulum dunhuangense]|uniref:Response regulator transcription factor n=1 Tax=Halovulum dunhuangense TaxID=1505036 RepID=A0A849L6W2_9RHOB|nr:response regulator transcription factor [Halovulum dunhuangense]NNU82195.1 response regulator transcription factor [Halovulum dunhuangense]
MPNAPTVLTLDDQEQITTLIESALKLDGLKVFVANTVREFEKIRLSEPIDIYLLDLVVPEFQALVAVKEIRELEDAGIIMLSGHSSEVDVVLGLELGADDYIAKPFRLRELRARVAAVHRRRKESALSLGAAAPIARDAVQTTDDVLKIGAWSINIAARRVKHQSGKAVALTTSEYDVLVYLVKNRNRVVTRNQIMDALRGESWASYDRLIDGFISRLRAKLISVDESFDYIQTVRGVGYCFSHE